MQAKTPFIHIKDLYFLGVIALLKVVAWLPPLKNFVAHSISLLAYQLSRRKRREAEANLTHTFGDTLGKPHRQHIVKGAFAAFWHDVFALCLSPTERAALKAFELSGVEYLHTALQARKGVILWESGSLGKRTLAKQILSAHGFSVCQVHAEGHLGGFVAERNVSSWVQHHLVKAFFERCERQFATEIVYLPRSDSFAFTRRLLDRLQHNAIICITGDASIGRKLLPQAFLGQTKLFATGMISLAKISGASILPIFCVQEEDGHTRLRIERPIQIKSGVEREQGLEHSLAEYVGLLESHIREYPEQYRSWHYVHRFSEDGQSALVR